MELTRERQRTALTWVERENAEIEKERKKARKWELLGGERNWKENLRRKKEVKDWITAPEEVKREAGDMYMKKKNETSKLKRQARTGSEEGEIECSLFQWLSDWSLWLSFPLFRFDCAWAY